MPLPLQYLFFAAVVVSALFASGHAIVYKRDSRSASIWVILVWVLPLAGALLYLLLGINRVQRRAAKLRRRRPRQGTPITSARPDHALDLPSLPGHEHLIPLARLVHEVAGRPLLFGNSFEPLVNGIECYPAMLGAIESAQHSVGLGTYIFDGSGIGLEFIGALERAGRRGVAVRVLIDDVDARFSRFSAVRPLKRAGITVGIFNPTLVPARLKIANLRNHRKIMVVDGTVGFTGGMNIDQRYWKPGNPKSASRDLHFKLRGPVVAHLAAVFAEDWHFSTGETLRGELWFPPLNPEPNGSIARGIEAGPDETFERLRWVLIGALNAASHSVRILTPYFIPDAALVSALNAAALRGVDVEIFLPLQSDLPQVQWAAFGQLWQVLQRGCRVWVNDGPFDHSKLMLVDGAWALLGSANWDQRSLRLNFEFGVECYDTSLAEKLEQLFIARRSTGRQLTFKEMNRRPLPVKLRDGIARLFAPYL